jgi:hypothetical protein
MAREYQSYFTQTERFATDRAGLNSEVVAAQQMVCALHGGGAQPLRDAFIFERVARLR